MGPARPADDILKPGGPKFLLRKLEFDASYFLTLAELDPIAAPFVGRMVDFADLQKIIAGVNALYAEKKIPTGIATLPPQKVNGGIVRIALTEGKLEKMTVTGAIRTRVNYILGSLDHVAGKVLDVPRLARDVTWFNRTNDTQIRALLQPGSSFGLTDVQLATTEAPANTLQTFWDNQGVKSTGRYQGGIYYRHSGALGIDDRFTFYGTDSAGSINGNVSYNVPFNVWGGRVGVSYTQGEIKVINGVSAPLDVHGNTKTAALNVSQPIWVDENWLISLAGAQSRGHGETRLSNNVITDDWTDKSTAGVSITASGTDYAITFAPMYNYVKSASQITNINRYFETYSFTGNAQVRLPANFSILANAAGQYTREKLLPGDQLFQIGGPTTVRGFPTNTVAGDSGYYVNLEVHLNLNEIAKGVDLYAFFDMGEVFSTFPPRTALYAAGAGASWTPHPSFTLEGSVGAPINTVLPDQPKQQLYFRGVFRPLLLVL